MVSERTDFAGTSVNMPMPIRIAQAERCDETFQGTGDHCVKVFLYQKLVCTIVVTPCIVV